MSECASARRLSLELPGEGWTASEEGGVGSTPSPKTPGAACSVDSWDPLDGAPKRSTSGVGTPKASLYVNSSYNGSVYFTAPSEVIALHFAQYAARAMSLARMRE
jgi:hypothetical protein